MKPFYEINEVSLKLSALLREILLIKPFSSIVSLNGYKLILLQKIPQIKSTEIIFAYSGDELNKEREKLEQGGRIPE
ncbi:MULTISPECIES: hypothetical protein [unclassified Lentimicrobium]|uniref:hypothetical protein n=1 Tax=unclassified Lentimicrobium TaxID=2677434 RepID=UPI001555C500|nr:MULTISPECIES: hypothetical protein [unclassified Lentimicrobium]NPD44963.1 hypothetical protein [Lentimicrobium sp. S6]NPD83469.1 hypothetical protein [Lentimicrobium sp. L6]